MGKKIVLAVSGALFETADNRGGDAVRYLARSIADLIQEGFQVLVTHGNKPQMNRIYHALQDSALRNPDRPLVEIANLIAMTQGVIGANLQRALEREFTLRGMKKKVVSLITQVAVDAADPAFAKPLKSVGYVMNKKEADELSRHGVTITETTSGVYQRVMPSPEPIEIVERQIIYELFTAGHVLIVCGGGGIPVVRKEDELYPVNAVIEKDFTAAKLARTVQADMLLLLTTIDKVYLQFGTSEQEPLDKLAAADATQYIMEGHFGSTSMLPKIQAAVEFAQSGKKNQAIIASVNQITEAAAGKAGTLIY